VTIILLLVKKLYFKKQLRNVKRSKINTITFILMYHSGGKKKTKKVKKGGKK